MHRTYHNFIQAAIICKNAKSGISVVLEEIPTGGACGISIFRMHVEFAIERRREYSENYMSSENYLFYSICSIDISNILIHEFIAGIGRIRTPVGSRRTPSNRRTFANSVRTTISDCILSSDTVTQEVQNYCRPYSLVSRWRCVRLATSVVRNPPHLIG